MPAPSLTTMLQGLIASPSISSTRPQLDMSNEGVIDLLADWAESAGFTVQKLAVPGESGKFNLIATLGRGTGGLVLAGHADTVPYDENGWQHDPFALTEADGRYYGLGTSDMKSFLALALEAARDLDPATLKHPLIILATADEETSMSGARALAAQDLAHARYAVIGEPTGLCPINQHKGIIMEAIIYRGQSGHSSDPSLGNNAMEGMYQLIGELLEFRDQLQSQHRNAAFSVPMPTLNLGHIHGGDNPNRICADCELHIDLRPLPGMPIDELRQHLRTLASQVAGERKLQYEFRELFGGIDAMQTDRTSAIVQAAEHLTHHSVESVAFGTEGPLLNQMGIDTLILGPGDIDQAHQPDEFLEIDRIQPTIDILKKLISRFCLEESRSRAIPTD